MGRERLSGDDTRILGLETAAIAGHTCKVAILAPNDGNWRGRHRRAPPPRRREAGRRPPVPATGRVCPARGRPPGVGRLSGLRHRRARPPVRDRRRGRRPAPEGDRRRADGAAPPGWRRSGAIVNAVSGPREFSLSVSNVPGPRDPVYVMGRRVRALCSVTEPADRHALRVAALSCSGIMHFGLCTDPDALRGLDEVEAGIDAAIDELGERC